MGGDYELIHDTAFDGDVERLKSLLDEDPALDLHRWLVRPHAPALRGVGRLGRVRQPSLRARGSG